MESRYIRGSIDSRTRSERLEKTIAKLYCVTLPFRIPAFLSPLRDILGYTVDFIPFIFHALGMLLWIINENGRIGFGVKEALVGHATRLIIWLNCSSIIMAVIMQSTFGNHGSESAFQGIRGMLIYFFQYLLMFIYNYRVFRLLSFDEINKLLHIDCLILLIIGYIQVLVMNGVGAAVYDIINFLGSMTPSTYLPKLCLTVSEGAAAGCLISVFIFPFLMSQILYGKRKYLYELLLWIIPLYHTFSATAYILAAANVAVFIALIILRSENPIKGITTLILSLLGAGVFTFVLFYSGILNENVINDINYRLFEKATDLDNGSTVARTIPLLVNWGAFKEYPLLGVGNGLQGYFYEDFFPIWARNARGSDAGYFLNVSREGISNGGIFIPGLLSGYGLVGCVLIIAFVWRCIQENKSIRSISKNFYFAYIIAGIAFIVMGFQGDAYGVYCVWFMLSIPFMSENEET